MPTTALTINAIVFKSHTPDADNSVASSVARTAKTYSRSLPQVSGACPATATLRMRCSSSRILRCARLVSLAEQLSNLPRMPAMWPSRAASSARKSIYAGSLGPLDGKGRFANLVWASKKARLRIPLFATLGRDLKLSLGADFNTPTPLMPECLCAPPCAARRLPSILTAPH
jgi:hypothetical protein